MLGRIAAGRGSRRACGGRGYSLAAELVGFARAGGAPLGVWGSMIGLT